MFPYPIRYFVCCKYTKEQQKLLAEHDRAFFDELNVYAGAVAGDTGVPGLRLDFCNGLRLQVPEGQWHVRISDADTGQIFFEEEVTAQILVSREKYYIHWQIEVWFEGNQVFSHIFDPTGQRVHIAVLSSALGDTLAFLPGVAAFTTRYHTQTSIYVQGQLQDFVHRLYPELVQAERVSADTYAVFWLVSGLGDPHWLPIDGRLVPLYKLAGVLLGLQENPVLRCWQAGPGLLSEPYVCISVQASSVLKSWLWPHGWDEVVALLKKQGYRVLCIDRERRQSNNGITVEVPAGAEDYTGNRPLQERADLLAHAEFFIGLGSGLSWLAWTAGCPVVMIAGFSASWYEFPSAYRAFNPLICHGCFNDVRVNFMADACPYHSGDKERFMECQRMISPRMVMRAVEQLQQDRGRE